jgi:GxxExxY protein
VFFAFFVVESSGSKQNQAPHTQQLSEGPPMRDMKALSDQVRQVAYDIHVYRGHGHLEKVYENALAHRLQKARFAVRQQHPIQVFDEDGTLIGDYYADLLVEGCLIIELKTARTLAPEHEAQVLGYLKSARLEHGLLINFGSYKFEIRKFAWSESVRSRPRGILPALLGAFVGFFAGTGA